MEDRIDRGLAMAGGLNGAAAGNRRAQGEQMSQWTNKSMRYRMKCAHWDVYGHIGIASAGCFPYILFLILFSSHCCLWHKGCATCVCICNPVQ